MALANHPSSTRRRGPLRWLLLLAACVAVALVAAGCGSSGSSDSGSSGSGGSSTSGSGGSGGGKLQNVSIRLDWLTNGSHAGFYVAAAKGYYKAAGLNVKIEEGQGSTQTVQLVGSGRENFGYVASSSLLPALTAGAPVRNVATVVQRNPAGILVRADAGVTDPRQLAGKTCAISQFGYIHQMLPAFYARTGLPQNAMPLVSVDAAAVIPTLERGGRIDALCDMLYEDVALEQAGTPVRVFRLSDYGINTLAHGIVASDSEIKNDPALVQRFVTASMRGFTYAFAHPDEAISIERAASRDVNVAQQRRVIGIVAGDTHTAASAGRPLGWTAPSDWQQTVDLMQRYMRFDPSKLPGGVAGAYTNQFVERGQ